MKDKQELVRLSFDICEKTFGSGDDLQAFESFFRFSRGFASTLSGSGDKFFECVNYCRDNPEASSLYLGKSGKNAAGAIRRWANGILSKEELKELSPDELAYVFGCCARICKSAVPYQNDKFRRN